MDEESEPRPKDRLIQTRVPRDLESTLKREARRRRLSVSHLIRNILEDTFQLVDDVVANVDEIVSDSVELARRVKREVSEAIREGVRPDEAAAPEPPPSAPEPPGAGLDHVYAWNRVVLNRAVACSRCGIAIARGAEAHAGLSDAPGAPRAWLCAACIGTL